MVLIGLFLAGNVIVKWRQNSGRYFDTMFFCQSLNRVVHAREDGEFE